MSRHCGIPSASSFPIIDYQKERNHQGLDNQVIEPGKEVAHTDGGAECREQLGGLLPYGYRSAAQQRSSRHSRYGFHGTAARRPSNSADTERHASLKNSAQPTSRIMHPQRWGSQSMGADVVVVDAHALGVFFAARAVQRGAQPV